MAGKKKAGRAAQHEADDWDEGLDDESADESEESEDESEPDEKPRKSGKGKLAEMENTMARAFYKALSKLRDGKATKGSQPPKKPERGFFESVAEFFGVDE